MKGLAALACVISLSLGAACGLNLLSWNTNPEDPDGFYYSHHCMRAFYQESSVLKNRLFDAVADDGKVSAVESQRLNDFLEEWTPDKTNLRYEFRKESGEVLFTNVPETAELEGLVYSVSTDEFWLDYYENDEYAEETFVFSGGVAYPLTVHDTFMEAAERFATLRSYLPTMFWTALGGCLLGLLLLVYLLAVAGRRPGREEVVLNWQDRIPYDLYLAIVAGGMTVCTVLAADAAGNYVQAGDPFWLAAFSAGVLAMVALGLAALLTTAARLKARALLRNTLLWRACAWCWKYLRRLGAWWRETFGSWDVTRRVILLFLLYLLGSVLTTLTIVLAPVYQGAVLYGLCKWLKGWKAIRAGTGRILGGEPDAAIDLEALDRPICRELRAHAEELNDLGAAIDNAVGERMKSERMKSELITNVSHDLKTPLTSIINYVDLLKKEDIPNEKAREYIEVLDRKSQRLKKLTEDLVEASKASSGALTVERAPLNFCQLARQALGEYEEKLTAAQLTTVTDLPEEALWVQADGRHLWRVLDNLLGNCVKYAMPGTRVYLDLKKWDGNAVLSLKNISSQPLNVPVDQLMERFVRGDESRTTEGSGLGLSIAKSLTELQGGTFSLSIDGDLFKAVFRLPLIKPPAEPAEEPAP